LTTKIVGGWVWDSTEERFSAADIEIEGDRILRIVERESTERSSSPSGGGPPSTPSAASQIDAAGLYLLPGLIDCHVHLAMRGEDPDPAANASRSDEEIRSYAASAAERTVRGGTTTVRDVGGWNYVEMDVRRDIEDGNTIGPTLVLAGRLLSMPTPAVRYYPGMYEVARGKSDVRRAARSQLERGADVIKVMATGAMLSPEEEDAAEVQLSREEIGAAVVAAEEEGKPVAAHAHALGGIRNAVEAGVASIEHGTFADDEVLARMAAEGVFLVPTIAASASMMKDERIMSEMPAHLRTRLATSHRTHAEMINRAWAAGVPIAMGTDSGTPGNHHGDNADECIYMVEEAGMTPADVIRAATVNAAELLRRGSDVGTLEEGKFADIIGCAGDPHKDMAELTRPVLVMKRGTLIWNR
jgi:imidazolonepropionase-like amidohydrolase